MEEWGSGYKRIKNACEESGYPLSDWEEFGSVLRATFCPHSEIVELGTESGTQMILIWCAGIILLIRVE